MLVWFKKSISFTRRVAGGEAQLLSTLGGSSHKPIAACSDSDVFRTVPRLNRRIVVGVFNETLIQ